MSNFQKHVELFHKTFRLPAPTTPTLFPNADLDLDAKLHELRVKLLQEELDELDEALREHDVVEVADAIADILYLAYGTAVSFGIDINPVFEEVQRSNMSKLDENGQPLFREDGKVIKSKLYTPPDIKPIIDAQMKDGEGQMFGDTFRTLLKASSQND